MTTQDRFTLALHATWSVLRDPVLTKIYMRQWKRYTTKCSKILIPGEKLLSLYGFVFNLIAFFFKNEKHVQFFSVFLYIGVRRGVNYPLTMV